MGEETKFYQQGRKAEEQGRFNEAAAFYKAAIKAAPNFRPALLNLGALYSRARQSKLSIGFYLRALELEEDSIACFNLGSEFYRLADLDKSEQFLKRALKLDRKLLRAHLLLAYIHGKRKRLDKSIIYFKNAIVLDPGNRMAALGLCTALADDDQSESALQTCNDYLLKNNKDQAFLSLRAGLLLKLGRGAEAEALYSDLARNSKKFTSFSDHLQAARAAGDQEYSALFDGIKDKIKLKSDSLRAKIAERKATRKQSSASEKASDIKDLVDLSFMHLFNGDQERALKFLFQARKLKS